jgi:hypothetical protein
LEKIPVEKIDKILAKLIGQAYMRYIEGSKPQITVPEFKFIITRFHIRRHEWFRIAKSLETRGVVTVRGGNPLLVHLANTDIFQQPAPVNRRVAGASLARLRERQ